ncbi:hypothetical protein BDV96DRAFT_603994 [Lophiotrema nucula]|uniref:F-box domain-containing protein n=1 Tax=Lophiotrema nucula TaxID=690887 RepID=A0A6A5YTE9_9PLEO|nr:hypothetical protein BDV96DRAFT_603994 [Lophiotrema nucula]
MNVGSLLSCLIPKMERGSLSQFDQEITRNGATNRTITSREGVILGMSPVRYFIKGLLVDDGCDFNRFFTERYLYFIIVTPRREAEPPAPLLRLPDELLLKIAHQLASVSRHKNLDLRNLAIVCQRLRPVAQEALLTACIEVLRIVNIDAMGIEGHLSKFVNSKTDAFTKLSQVELYHQYASDRLEVFDLVFNGRSYVPTPHPTAQQIWILSNTPLRPYVLGIQGDLARRIAQYEDALETLAVRAQTLGFEIYIWYPVNELQAIDAYGHPWQYTEEERRKLEYQAATLKEEYRMKKRLEVYQRQEAEELEDAMAQSLAPDPSY